MELLKNWREEMRSAYLYGIMAENEGNELHKKLFIDLKAAAEKQARLWEARMPSEGIVKPAAYKPDLRVRIIAKLVQWLGAENLHFMLSAMKIRGMSVFTRYHSEHHHRTLSYASNLRAAIFGVNDGLVSNVSLILGIAGASSNQQFILLAGVAGLLAGACSMGAGEYISVRSQREVYEYQIAIEKEELEEYPEEEMEELSLIYQARGIPKVEAERLSRIMIENPDTGLNTLAREELGLNPDDLVSPIGAMLSSFFAFCFGASIPLLPFILSNSSNNLYYSIGSTGCSLFAIGAILSLFTNKNPVLLGTRMLTIGAIAGAITYSIGSLLGINI